MSGLLVAGAGGHGKVVAETAHAMGAWGKIAFLDDRHETLQGTLAFPVLGGMNKALDLKPEFSDLVVAVGDAATRQDLLKQFAEKGFGLPSLIHPTAWVSPSSVMGEGTVVFAQAGVNADAHIGRGVIVNTGATVDHDCVIADSVHVCPGVHLGGGVSIGSKSWIGIGCSVIQGVHIGERVMVGAGAAVIGDIADDLTVVGVPARAISSIRNMS